MTESIEQIEQKYQYGTDEESIYEEFEHDSKSMPHPVKKSFSLKAESKEARNQSQKMMTRFSEKTQTYEFIVMFQQTVEKTDESVIDQNL